MMGEQGTELDFHSLFFSLLHTHMHTPSQMQSCLSIPLEAQTSLYQPPPHIPMSLRTVSHQGPQSKFMENPCPHSSLAPSHSPWEAQRVMGRCPLRDKGKGSKPHWEGSQGRYRGLAPGSPRLRPSPTRTVHLAPVGNIWAEYFAPLPAVDLEDAIVGAPISFMVHSSCVEATCEVSKTDPCIGWRHEPEGQMTETSADQDTHGAGATRQLLRASSATASRLSGHLDSHLL